MSTTVRCRLRVTAKNHSVRHNADQTTGVNCQVTLTPVYESDPAKRDPENELFGKATPSASFTMLICNERAHEALEMGKDYYIDISPVPTP